MHQRGPETADELIGIFRALVRGDVTRCREAIRMPEIVRVAALCRWSVRLSAVFIVLGSTVPARADDASPPGPLALPPVVVSGATFLPTPEDQLGSSVTVITSRDIQAKQQRTLPEVLFDVPGLNVVQTGSPGGQTSVFIRGTNSNHTKVLIDGIDVSDPSSPNNAFDFSQILASDIEQVEVLRGPQSGLYGSDAIGGVVNIITKTGSGPPRVHGMIEGGSFNTFNQSAGLSGSLDRFTYNFDVFHFHTGETQVTPSSLVVPGRPLNTDYDDNKTFSGKVGARLTDNFDVGAVVRYADTFLQSTSDDFLGPEAIPSNSINHDLFTRGFAHLVLFDGVFDQTLGVGYTHYHRNFLDPNPGTLAFGNDPSTSNGARTKLDWKGTVKLMPGEGLVLGVEHQIDHASDTTPVDAQITNDAGFIELQSNPVDRLFNAINVRYDGNSAYGGHATFREAPSYLIPETGTRLKGSVGTGFKAPSLDELYESFPAFGFFANPNLKPETSLGYDFGFEQSLWNKQVEFGSTFFRNDIDNLIQSTATSYENIGHATAYGAENFVAYSPWDTLTFRADYTYTLANDEVTHTELLRRPKHKASLNAKWQATDALSFTATTVYTGEWADLNRSGSQTGLRSTPYTLINLAGNYDFGNGLSFFTRINNLLDRRYEDPIGFQHQGFGVFAGVRVAFDVPTASQH
ncbi:MAG TPA: TonB-dependent receptor [Stellaceae bacterium]|nr:TonB-dependent receptor [Stellaceae bacterium]